MHTASQTASAGGAIGPLKGRWSEAFTLSERAALKRSASGPLGPKDEEMAHKRFQKWTQQTPFNEADRFSARLAWNGLSPRSFLDILGRPAASMMGVSDTYPVWHEALDRLIGQASFQDAGDGDARGFDAAVEPFLHWGKEQLLDTLTSLSRRSNKPLFDVERLAELFLKELRSRLVHSALRTLVLELNVSRVQGKLTRALPAERFQEYCDGLRSAKMRQAVFSEYPVLARYLWKQTSNWRDFSLEVIRDLVDDWPEICSQLLGSRDVGMVKDLNMSAGDLHRGGRSVMIIHFESGARVVYKPHNLAVDVHFQELLAWFNQRGWKPEFRLFGILQRKNHGWAEFIERKPCDTREQIAHFYRRAGGLLTILHLLEATDFHYENLIASGSDPVLVDMEALFHPRISQFIEQPFVRFVGHVLEETVIRVGLLPQRMVIGPDGELDIGGLSADAIQTTPFMVPCLEGAGTDMMHYGYAPTQFPGGDNHPQLGEEKIGLEDYIEEIIDGFRDAYQLILANKRELACSLGPIERFAEDEVRLIPRPTRLYARLLEASLHPNVMRNALDRDLLLDRLFVGLNLRPKFLRIAQMERADLENGDIPFFAVQPGSCNVVTSTGKVLHNLLQHPSLHTAMSRLESLGDKDLERQLLVIRGTIVAHSRPRDTNPLAVAEWMPDSDRVPSREELIEAAKSIGDQIANTAYIHNGFITWMNPVPMPAGWKMLPMDLDFYGGLSGVSVFLAFLAELTGEESYRDMAERALSTALASVETLDLFQPVLKARLGAFSGISGLIFTLCVLSRLWRDPELINRAEGLAKRCGPLIETDISFDFMDGVAGYSSVMETLYRSSGSPLALDQIVRCGQHLVANARSVGDGVAWMVEGTALTGLAHGAAGIALALFRIASTTRESAFRDTAMAALRFERMHFNAISGDWADLQPDRDSPETRVAWCHGAPGIGLTRLAMRPYVCDAEIMADLEAALITTRNRGFGHSHCLCHGDLGNALFLHEAGTTLERSNLTKLAKQRAAVCCHAPSWRCGMPEGMIASSFMLGLSGIGYALLRLAAPELVPYLLTLRME